MSAAVNDERIASQALRRRSSNFRRGSVDKGLTTDVVERIERQLSGDLGNSELVNSFIGMIKGAGNVSGNTKEWLRFNDLRNHLQQASNDVFEGFFSDLATTLTKPLKMARRGMAGNLLISLTCTYGDLFSDGLMAHYYWKNDSRRLYITCCAILAFSLFAQGLVAFVMNHHLPLSKRLMRVIPAVCSVNPALFAYRYWSGEVAEEGSTETPLKLMTISKFVELLCESLPQLVVQLTAIFDVIINSDDSIDALPVISIVFSIIAVGFVVADLGVTIERGFMNENLRGPYSHQSIGVIPEDVGGGRFFLGYVVFNSGFFAMALITMTATVKAGWGYIAAIYEITELLLFLALMNATGRGRWLLGGTNQIGLFDVLRPEWLLGSITPFLMFRWDHAFMGGALWSGFSFYRVVLMTVVTQACSDALSVEAIFQFQTCTLSLVTLGYVTMVVFSSDSHRSTLYKTSTTPMSQNEWFGSDNVALELSYKTHDEARLFSLTKFHPYYFAESSEEVKLWILSREIDDELFSEGVVPKGVDSLKGQDFEAAFRIIKERYRYYNDKKGDVAIGKHLDSLLVEVQALKENIVLHRSLRQSNGSAGSVAVAKSSIKEDVVDMLRMRINDLEERLARYE